MRIIDLITALIGLVVLSPLMLIIAVLIKLESSGPVLFKQTRIGKNQKPFTCLKFRSMFIGTANKPTHEINKSNITKVGNVLRRTKLDEVPQLLNVLCQDMALVGPRPCLPSQEELIEARQKRGALAVRPGITGLAQVNGIDMSNVQRLARVDAYYAKYRSLTGDLCIMMQTVFHIIKS